MGSSDNAPPESITASTGASAEQHAEQLAEQVRTLEAVVARYEHRLSGAQEASRDWERIFDAIEDPICVVTSEYQLVYANAAYNNVFGTAHEPGGQHYCFASAPDHASQSGQRVQNGPCAGCPLPETARTRRASFTEQAWRPSGGDGAASVERLYQRWTYPVVSSTGSVDRVVEMLKDVTEQHDMRRSVANTEALREADRLKAELLGTVSHELRSPLTAIKGYAATLLRHEGCLPREERREFLEAIGEASDRLEVMINRLLELSQLETGSIRPHFMPVDVAHIARESIAIAEQRAQASEPDKYVFGLRMIGTPATTGSSMSQAVPVIDADIRLLRDLLDNLLENAVKYSPRGGAIDVTLGVRSAGSAPGGRNEVEEAKAAGHAPKPKALEMPEMLEIVVRDTGMGIPAEHLGRVFERFHRVDTRLTREVDGPGLGLAVCKRIAELHGGTIWAESAPGEGSAFHLVLPLARADHSDVSRQALVSQG